MNENRENNFISITDAAKELEVNRTTMYYYIKQMKAEQKKFPLDRRAYISREDFRRIQEAKQAATAKQH